MTEKTPEEIAKDVADKTAAKAAKEKYINEVKVAINAAPTDANVRIILRHVMNICGLFANPAVERDADLKVSSTIYNVGRQSPYHDIRRLMSAETKNAVERSE